MTRGILWFAPGDLNMLARVSRNSLTFASGGLHWHSIMTTGVPDNHQQLLELQTQWIVRGVMGCPSHDSFYVDAG